MFRKMFKKINLFKESLRQLLQSRQKISVTSKKQCLGLRLTALMMVMLSNGCTDSSKNIGTGELNPLSAELSIDSPVVLGRALYLDLNQNGMGAGDELIIPFNRSVVLKSTALSSLSLPVSGDSFGSGASLSAGPRDNEITVNLGSGALLTIPQTFNQNNTSAGSASGVDISASIAPGAIESISGIDARASAPIDLMPGFFNSNISLDESDSYGLALGDLDGDTDLDMVVANYDQPNRVYFNELNDVANTITDSGQTLGNNQSTSVALGDLDGDTDLDMVVANYNQPNKIYFNNGAGMMTDSAQSLGNGKSFAVVLLDIDNNGSLDIVFANADGESNRIFLNNGAGVMSDSMQDLGAFDTYGIAVGDMDGDGSLDLAMANYNQGNKIYLNNGAGIMIDSNQSLGSGKSFGVSLGDIDGDTDLDLLAANDSEANKLYLNDGSGVMLDSGQSLGNARTVAIKLGDIDGDGDLDAVAANAGNRNQGNRVYVNDGAGIMEDSNQSLGDYRSFDLALGDMDGDGDQDLVVTNLSGDDGDTPPTLYRNELYFNSLANP